MNFVYIALLGLASAMSLQEASSESIMLATEPATTEAGTLAEAESEAGYCDYYCRRARQRKLNAKRKVKKFTKYGKRPSKHGSRRGQ